VVAFALEKMPINLLHSLVHRVEQGWDPISHEYADKYAEAAWHEERVALIERLEFFAGGFKGKRVLDLGGGPGQYSALMAQRGARVTWHDVSREYERVARVHAQAAGVSIDFSLGYLEEAAKFEPQSFDIIFCRLCWSYCRSDRRFARLLYTLLRPRGVGYIECNTPEFARPRRLRKLSYWLNEHLWWKIGHPLPPHGRITKLVQKYPFETMIVDYSSELSDVLLFVKGTV
jgi:2-polyprenyl-3-methyl-5-hydroxy-6-metoxy-1,4-benzoquinol methylase